MKIELKPCPFCGGSAEIERMGSSKQSSIIQCEDCGCRLESNESDWSTGMAWNNRHVQLSGFNGKEFVPLNPEDNKMMLEQMKKHL